MEWQLGRMGAIEKLKQDLKGRPRSFTWGDMRRVLLSVGYSECTGGKTSGSRIRFTHPVAAPIVLHKPHPGNEMKHYAIKLVADMLEAEGLL